MLAAMDLAMDVIVAFHFIGIGALLGGFMTQMKAMGSGEARMVPAMLHGALTMLVTGVILVGLREADGGMPNYIKLGVKLAILVVILALVYLNRDEEKVSKQVFGAVGLLTIANIFIATIWH